MGESAVGGERDMTRPHSLRGWWDAVTRELWWWPWFEAPRVTLMVHVVVEAHIDWVSLMRRGMSLGKNEIIVTCIGMWNSMKSARKVRINK